MAYIDRVQPHDTTLNQKQLNLLRRIVQKKMDSDGRQKTSRGVFVRVARQRNPLLCTDEHKAMLAFAKAEAGEARAIRAYNIIAEREGRQDRLIDKSAPTISRACN